MGHIGNELVLIFLHLVQLHGHVVQGVGQIAHLVLGVELYTVGQVSCRVLRGRPGNFFQREIHGLGEEEQEDQRDGKDNSRCNVYNIQNTVLFLCHQAHGHVDHNIAVCVEISRYGRRHGQHLIRKHSVVHSNRIGLIASSRRVEIFNGASGQSAAAVHDDGALVVYNPDVGGEVGCHSFKLGFCRLQIQLFSCVDIATVFCNQVGLIVQRLRLLFYQIVMGYV